MTTRIPVQAADLEPGSLVTALVTGELIDVTHRGAIVNIRYGPDRAILQLRNCDAVRFETHGDASPADSVSDELFERCLRALYHAPPDKPSFKQLLDMTDVDPEGLRAVLAIARQDGRDSVYTADTESGVG